MEAEIICYKRYDDIFNRSDKRDRRLCGRLCDVR